VLLLVSIKMDQSLIPHHRVVQDEPFLLSPHLFLHLQFLHLLDPFGLLL
jgi:hypothetical protein